MGYQTEVNGCLHIVGRPLQVEDVLYINRLFWGHPDNGYDNEYMTKYDTSMGMPRYVQLRFSQNLDAIEWDGSEKFYKIQEAVNFIIQNIKHMGLGLKGKLECQGESMDDRFIITIGSNGYAHHVPVTPAGEKVTCPHCNKHFFHEGC